MYLVTDSHLRQNDVVDVAVALLYNSSRKFLRFFSSSIWNEDPSAYLDVVFVRSIKYVITSIIVRIKN